MPKLQANQLPSYRLHKQSGQAVVTLNGRNHLLGQYNSPASREKYNQLTSNWIAAGRQARPVTQSMTVTELLHAFRPWAENYYRNSHEMATFKPVMKRLRESYGSVVVTDFGPLKLKAFREWLMKPHQITDRSGKPVDRPGWTRRSLNKQINRVKLIFKWGVENELVPSSVYHGLQAVAALKKGRSDAMEADPVLPVPDNDYEATLKHLSPTIKAMVEVQYFSGSRPGEIIGLTPAMIDRAGTTWFAELDQHKTAHHGKSRRIFFGPRARAILAPMLNDGDPNQPIFSPIRSEADRRARLSTMSHRTDARVAPA